MKKINSNGYAHRVLALAALFLAGVPLCLCALEGLWAAALRPWIGLSMAIGALILLLFVLLLFIEFHQDRRINLSYAAMRKRKLALGNGKYECQACGNRRVTASDHACGACGILFEGKGEAIHE